MEWYKGNVNDALNDYQHKNGIMVVYIHDENDQNSNKFDELWNSFDIHSAIKQTSYIAIRMLKNSEGAQQFAQFFPTLTIPVCYILGLNAQPLEVITALEGLSSDQLFAAFSKANKLYYEQLKEAGILKLDQLEGEKIAKTAKPGSTLIHQNIESEATKGMTKEEKEITNEAESEATKGMTKEEKEITNEAESEAAKGMTKEEKEITNEAESEATKGMTKEEKLAYYRKLIEDNKKATAQKEKEEELQKEIQRRNEGKAMAEIREKQREKELRESAEARRKQKEEDAAALKKLRDQLKADKEERAKRNKGEIGDESTKIVEKAATLAAEAINKPINTDECRIQCRFPDGSTLNLSLPSKEPLQVVYDAVSMEPRKPANFFLVQPYPRRKLTEMNKSLLDHGLTPSSVILVIANENPQNNSLIGADGYLNMLFGIFYFPIVAIYQFFRSWWTTGNNKKPAKNAAKNPEAKEKTGKTMKDGNFQRFKTDDSDHSDNEATWNGNSTQQL